MQGAIQQIITLIHYVIHVLQNKRKWDDSKYKVTRSLGLGQLLKLSCIGTAV